MPLNWKDLSTGLSITSVILAPLGVVFPDLLGKAVFALSVGLANAAIIAFKHKEECDEVTING